jgi:hypothetical protein
MGALFDVGIVNMGFWTNFYVRVKTERLIVDAPDVTGARYVVSSELERESLDAALSVLPSNPVSVIVSSMCVCLAAPVQCSLPFF